MRMAILGAIIAIAVTVVAHALFGATAGPRLTFVVTRDTSLGATLIEPMRVPRIGVEVVSGAPLNAEDVLRCRAGTTSQQLKTQLNTPLGDLSRVTELTLDCDHEKLVVKGILW